MGSAAPESERKSAAGHDPDQSIAVSVVIPCFNSSACLGETVRSVLAQTRRDFEIVFVDDGSEDGTASLIEGIIDATTDVPLRLLRQANAGTAAARNRGIAQARGRWVLPLDADDLIAPTMLQQCAAVLEAEPRIDLVYTDREDFGDIGALRTAGTYGLARLKYFNQIPYCSLYRRSIWQAVGGYRTNVSGFDDWDFWIATALLGCRAEHVGQPLFRHRRSGRSQLWGLLPQFERLHAQIIVNNRAAYTEDEVAMAWGFLCGGEPSAMLRSAHFLFVARYYEGYERKAPGAPCG